MLAFLPPQHSVAVHWRSYEVRLTSNLGRGFHGHSVPVKLENVEVGIDFWAVWDNSLCIPLPATDDALRRKCARPLELRSTILDTKVIVSCSWLWFQFFRIPS
jgi:hypothetical protein